MDNPNSSAAAPGEITRTSGAIHQEVMLNAAPHRVYEALTNAAQFSEIIKLGLAAQSGPAQISAQTGGEFVLFGGYITGRQLELVPDTRIVQAWRVGNWAPGQFSLACFQLSAAGVQTLLVFNHTGFPSAEAEHLAAGWHGNYWEPLRKYLK